MKKRTSLKGNFDETKLLDLAKDLHDENNNDCIFIYLNGWSYHFTFVDSKTIVCRSWESDVEDFILLTEFYPCISCIL